MLTKRDRVASLLEDALTEMDLLTKMSIDIRTPNDFVANLSGLTAFRACGMSLQYITESFVKIRNLCGKGFFHPYSSIPWDAVFGLRNFLSHEYGDVDAEGFFNTVKTNIPELIPVAKQILSDLQSGKLSIGDD